MARPLVLPDGFTDHDFKLMMMRESHGRNRVRLLAMHHLQLGKSLKYVSNIVGVHWKTVQSWLKRFRVSEFPGLFESPRSGAPRKITGEAETWLSEKICTLSEAKTGGQITGKELQQLLLKEHGVSCALKTIYNKLHQLNYSWITSRSMHPKSSAKVQEDYKKTSKTY